MALKQLLLVDDDDDDVYFFRDVVGQYFPGVEVHACGDGEEALAFLRKLQAPLDWIFLDLNMPRMNGVQLLKTLKEEAIETAPIIIYTTSHLEKDKDQTLSLGARHYVVKPERTTDLRDHLQQVFERKW